MPDTGYVFNGVGHVEAQDRTSEMRSGVPGAGAGTVLLNAPVKRTSAVRAHNVGEEAAHVRLRHQGATKAETLEHLTALAASATRYVGKLLRKSIVPGSVSVLNAGAPPTIVDDGAGKLYDTGFVGNPANLRGTIDYVNGVIDVTFGAAPTEPVRATYQHTDYTDFLSPTQTTAKAAAAYPFSLPLGYGRVNPRSVSYTDTVLTFVDDGKGNIIETTGGGAVKRGTIDYATGVVTQASGSIALVGTVTALYTFNPFASLVAKAGGSKLLDIFSGIPEITGEAWADGVKGESRVGLWGETRSNVPTNLVTEWTHFGEEPYRVEGPYSGFPPGGEANDPSLLAGVAHL